ncbi:MS Related Protein [Caenorhabditis elegans]|uniref:MS Related Protein n=1 Tax=Caenorhabditis elegans TaxID=6239 RepID=D0Z5N0_CAEEL|nr:MS Related Protein [Caenorhabditis elegans]CBI63239.1 MS Related Protein [Caenorhabditis elegans]|eukprot:NP_001255137.1 Uncharacterized protein CELE_Y41C4A.22 [Caenorhabditis elegans]
MCFCFKKLIFLQIFVLIVLIGSSHEQGFGGPIDAKSTKSQTTTAQTTVPPPETTAASEVHATTSDTNRISILISLFSLSIIQLFPFL